MAFSKSFLKQQKSKKTPSKKAAAKGGRKSKRGKAKKR